MVIGKFLPAAETPGLVYQSAWFPSGGNEIHAVVDLIHVIGSGTVKVEVETKNSEQDDDSATLMSGGGSGTLSTAGRTAFSAGASIEQGSTNAGLLELSRYKITVIGTDAGDGVYIRMLNPSWLSH